jgi:hypothetical protein
MTGNRRARAEKSAIFMGYLIAFHLLNRFNLRLNDNNSR